MWHLIAQAQPTPDPVTPLDWAQFGALGLVILGLLTGLLWAKPAVDRLLRDKDRAEGEVLEELRTLNRHVEEMRRERRETGP